MSMQTNNNDAFSAVLSTLNPQQLKAVEKIENPLLVIAGPGTGKTQILAARICNILKETDAQPQNILCITYTDAGSVAMRQRLLQFIGTAAYQVRIYTFHSFCNQIIQDNLDYFGKHSLEIISELEQVEIIRDLIAGFDESNPLKRYKGNIYFEGGKLKNLFSTMKKEFLSSAYISEKIDEYLADLPHREVYQYRKNSKDKKAGDLKEKDLGEEKDKMEKLRAATQVFDNYQKIIQEKNLYDYDDMILWVLKAFENDKNFLLNYQEQFQYVLVDEFQDTNGSQLRLVTLLMNYWDSPNLFIVGDEDQSIYRFQGANTQNFNQIRDEYAKTLEEITLVDNYRSSQTILDASKQLIDHSPNRNEKTLIAQNTQWKSMTDQPFVAAFEKGKEVQECAFVVSKVQEAIAQGVDPNEIAVLYKQHTTGEELAKYFHKANIPLVLKEKVNALEDPFIGQLICILTYIATESKKPYTEDSLLFEILHYPYFNLAGIELAQLSFRWSGANTELRKSHKPTVSFRYFIHQELQKKQPDFFEPEHWKNLRTTHEGLEKLIATQLNLTVQDVFEEVVRKSNMIAYIFQHKEKYWMMELLRGFFEVIKAETHKHPTWRIQDMVNYFSSLELYDLKLKLDKNLYQNEGVNFITCHSSKGLEFEYVFLIGASSKNWEEKRKANNRGFKFPDTLSKKDGEEDKEESHEELRRLFYVACTRAKKQLYISYQGEQSCFVAEMGNKLTEVSPTQDNELLAERFATLFKLENEQKVILFDENIIKPYVADFVLSASHLNSYLRCPISYYFDNIVRVPQKKLAIMTYGSAVHYALERAFKRMMEHPNKEFPVVEDVIKDLKWFIDKGREAFSDQDLQDYLTRVQKYFAVYYEHKIATTHKDVICELNIRDTTFRDVPIKGMLDQLVQDSNTYIVDYKTGKKATEKFKRPDDKQIYGGDYWRQAVFYKILAENYPQKKWEISSVNFEFLEDDKKEFTEKMVITLEDVALVGDMIQSTYQKIKNLEFTEGCNDKDCKWCNFVKRNQTHLGFDSITEE